MRWRRLFQGIAVAAVAMLFASACLSEDGGGGGGGDSEGGAGDKQVEIMYGFGGDQSKGFEQAMALFEKSSGVTVKFTDASQSFDTLIRPRVQGNNPPDIALFPQPGLMLDFAKQGKLQDLGTMLDINQLKGALVPGVLGVLSLVAYPIHLVLALRALLRGLSFDSVARLQRGYRTLYALLGIGMVAALVLR